MLALGLLYRELGAIILFTLKYEICTYGRLSADNDMPSDTYLHKIIVILYNT